MLTILLALGSLALVELVHLICAACIRALRRQRSKPLGAVRNIDLHPYCGVYQERAALRVN